MKTKKFIIKIFALFFLVSILFLIKINQDYHIKVDLLSKKNKNCNNNKVIEVDDISISGQSRNKCYELLDNQNLKVIHFIITRFLIHFYKNYGFPKKLYDVDYIPNGIRVLKKFLLTSLQNQSCKDFIWILMVGEKVNITYIRSILDFKTSFEIKIIYQRDIRNYISDSTKGYDILITTRIDYDDEIYFDAVNDVRKAININKPMIIHGYNRGVYYFESEKKYYDFIYKNKLGIWSTFISLILVLKTVNGTYSVYDLGDHTLIKYNALNISKLFGIKEINYEPTILDSGDPKFIYVRQKYSGSFNYTRSIPKMLNAHDFNISRFYGKL